MLRADTVAEIVARAERGEGSRGIARELGVDRKTVRRWLKVDSGNHGNIGRGHGRSMLRGAARRWDGTGWCCSGSWLVWDSRAATHQVQRFIKPLHDRRRWAELATVRFETEPGEQARWISDSSRYGLGSGPKCYISMCFPWGIRAACSALPIPTSGRRHCWTVM